MEQFKPMKDIVSFVVAGIYVVYLTLSHSEWPKLQSFGHSECNRVNKLCQGDLKEGLHVCSYTRFLQSCRSL